MSATFYLGTLVRGAMALAVGAGALVAPPGPAASGQDGACGWADLISVETKNVLFIDEAGTYWSAAVPVPAGGHVELAGELPRARYLSVAVYDRRGSTVDHLADHQIEPDTGSVNPFRSSADADADRRYTLRVVEGRRPADPPANTLYTESADGTRRSDGIASVTLRTYLPDDPDDPTGGAGLPTITSVTDTGARTALESCLDDDAEADPGAGPGLRVPGGGGADPPAWERFLPNGLGENVDNAYVYETFTPSHGPVLILRAKAPTVGLTADEGAELRYWSMCSNLLTTAVLTCLVDEEVPVDEDGWWTIVVSRRDDRPANATTECGVAWLEAAPDDDSILVYRHMLPDPSFTAAIQHVDAGTEQEQMGDHYPVGTYSSVADHEALGCTRAAPPETEAPTAAGEPAAGEPADIEAPTRDGADRWPLLLGATGLAAAAGLGVTLVARRRRSAPTTSTWNSFGWVRRRERSAPRSHDGPPDREGS